MGRWIFGELVFAPVFGNARLFGKACVFAEPRGVRGSGCHLVLGGLSHAPLFREGRAVWGVFRSREAVRVAPLVPLLALY